MWGVKPLSVLPGTKYKTATLSKCCGRLHKPRNLSLQPGIQLSSALGLKSTVFCPLPPWLRYWQVVPWKELLYTGNIDLMMINTPCFPQRESRSTCWLAVILILSLEDFSHGAVFWKPAKRRVSVSPLGNSYCMSTALHNDAVFAATIMVILRNEPFLETSACVKFFVEMSWFVVWVNQTAGPCRWGKWDVKFPETKVCLVKGVYK